MTSSKRTLKSSLEKVDLVAVETDPLKKAKKEIQHLKEDLLSYSHQFNNLLVGIEGGARLLVVEGLIAREGDSLIAGLLDSVRRAAVLSESIQKRFCDENAEFLAEKGKSESEERSNGMNGTLLVVDDEEIVRSVSKEILSRAGFRVLSAESGEQALALYEVHRREIDGVLLDLTMPYMSGSLVYARLKALNPDVRVVLMSGYSDVHALSRYEGIVSFVPKPFSPEKLVDAMNQAAAPSRRDVQLALEAIRA